ncbi:MAG: gluconate 2-dehydrogenase subunit 3 family protein [Chitinophagaceae bacterium]
MDRRKSLKIIGLGSLSTSLLLDACEQKSTGKLDKAAEAQSTLDRTPEEKEKDDKLTNAKLFTDHERKTIAVLSNIIIPADAVSGSATDAKVPEFIETISLDMPDHQTPLKGGLRWLDLQCTKNYEKPFVDCTKEQQIAMVDQIAYPAKTKPGMEQGTKFFTLMRNLVISGFYTSQIGIKDIGYMGNKPNQWNGVPDDVLKQYGLAYSEKELKECISFP